MLYVDMGKLTNLCQLEIDGFAYLSHGDMLEIHEKIDFKFHCMRESSKIIRLSFSIPRA